MDLRHVDDQISRETFIQEQARDTDCQNYASFVPKTNSNIIYNTNGRLMHIAHLDGTLQKFVQTNLLKLVLYLIHYPRLQGRPGAAMMFNSL